MIITPNELKQRLSVNDPVIIVDVREELEFHTFNIGGDNIPLGKLAQVSAELEYEKEDEIVVICQRGIRSETGCRILSAAGFKNVRNLSGGLLAYNR